MSGTRSRILLTAAIVFCLTGCTRTIRVIVDNGDSKPIQVFVNGNDRGTVAAGAQLPLIIKEPGETVFTIKQNGELIRTESHKLEYKPGGLSTRTYLFNPDRTRYYLNSSVQYGESRFQAAITTFVNKNANKEKQLQFAFDEAKAESRPLETNGWNDISGSLYVLTALPETVTTKSSGRSIRTIQSVAKPLHDALTAIHSIKKPTVDDLEKLFDLGNQAYDLIEFE